MNKNRELTEIEFHTAAKIADELTNLWGLGAAEASNISLHILTFLKESNLLVKGEN